MFRITTAAALLVLSANTAWAARHASVDVPFGDLNLSQAKDAKVLADRLQIAAKQVCLDVNKDLANDRLGQNAMAECVESAISVALGYIESSQAQKIRANLVSARQSKPVP